MARPKKENGNGNDEALEEIANGHSEDAVDSFTSELIKQINKEHNERIAFNLGTDDAPTVVKRWISTGSRQLDYIIANQNNGGLPEGRIVEIQGSPGIGKSNLAYLIARNTQLLGGIAVYIDTENATSLENLQALGVDVFNRFVFVQTVCTEEILSVIESTVLKARAMKKDVPVTVIWDSVSQSSPRAELEGDYDQNSIGLQARTLSKGLRKISSVIANQKVLLCLISQQRMKIGVMYGNPITTGGGLAIPYAASVRINLTGGKQVEQNGKTVGIEVNAKTIKNKVNRPFRECSFSIIFGKGIVEHEQVFDLFREYCDNAKENGVVCDNVLVKVEGTAAWKEFMVSNRKTGEVLYSVKFHKPDFAEKVLNVPEYKKFVDALYDATLIMKAEQKEHPTYTGIGGITDTQEGGI